MSNRPKYSKKTIQEIQDLCIIKAGWKKDYSNKYIYFSQLFFEYLKGSDFELFIEEKNLSSRVEGQPHQLEVVIRHNIFDQSSLGLHIFLLFQNNYILMNLSEYLGNLAGYEEKWSKGKKTPYKAAQAFLLIMKGYYE